MISDVADWLRGLGLEQYAPAFRDNDIDGAILPELTADDLTGLGVTSIGHRRKLLAAISALRQEAAPSATAAPGPAVAVAQAAASAERRQLTVLLCDLVGSTELAARLDPEDLREIIAAYHHQVTEVLIRNGGFVAKYMGDGILAYFGYPQAHEDDAERSIRAGLAIAEAITRLPLSLPQALQVRIGIATGLVVVGDLLGSGAAQEEAVVGETPNLAARLQALAEPNAVIIADATRRQTGTLFEVHDLGPQRLKGFADEQRAWRVAGESGVESRFAALRTRETALVGREEELDLLLRRWNQAKSGEGRVVLLSAEPGIGKSRLAEALIEHTTGETSVRLRYFCSPHHQDSTMFPILAQLERAAGFSREDSPATKLAKLKTLLGGGSPAMDDLPLIAELLSLPDVPASPLLELPPQRKKELTFAALLHQLETLAHRQPVLMVFEDLHWMDPTTRELLDRIVARVEDLPVLVIATFRPEFQPPWIGQAHITMLTLSRLGRRDGTALVGQLLASATALPRELVEEIVERTDGVPLFLEEVTKVVLEAAVSSMAGGTTVALPSTRLAVPPTLQASLMARLDRLGPAPRETAQLGAAIGRDFSYELLLAVSQRNAAETRQALDRLVEAGLIFQHGIPPAAEYQFKHALVQDTAYGTLLRGRRHALHARIAAAMRELYPELVERAPEVLAHHLTEAGQPDEAATYWLQAGHRAAGRSANVEAVAHLTRGIACLAELPDTAERNHRELALQLALGPALMSTGGFGEPRAASAYQRARTLAEATGDDRARFAAVWGSWLSARQANTPEGEEALMDELSRVAARLGDVELRLQAHHWAWATVMWRGRLVESRHHVREGLNLYDRDRHRHHALVYGGHDPGVCGYGQGAVTLWLLGYPDQAAQSAGDAIDLAGTLSHVPSVGHAFWFAAMVHYFRGEVPSVLDCSERLIALGREHGLTLYEAIGHITHGWALAKIGRAEEALPELRHGVGSYTARTMAGLFNTMLAEAELYAGSAQDAIRRLDEVDRETILRKQLFWRAGTLGVKGEALAGLRDEAAECCLRASLELARTQEAKSLELRAATGLARLLQQRGRQEKARELLAPVHGWFTEGLDTPDLKAAEALLASLA